MDGLSHCENGLDSKQQTSGQRQGDEYVEKNWDKKNKPGGKGLRAIKKVKFEKKI